MTNNLKRIRIERGLTQKEMANLLGYSLHHYNKVENGTWDKKLPIWKAAKLAKELNISLDEIFLEENCSD
ncbi:helix-turn-helix transcriptional regulator [Acinetobacter baumannii]